MSIYIKISNRYTYTYQYTTITTRKIARSHSRLTYVAVVKYLILKYMCMLCNTFHIYIKRLTYYTNVQRTSGMKTSVHRTSDGVILYEHVQIYHQINEFIIHICVTLCILICVLNVLIM